jgi:PAS domain S-box-containing protein
LKRGWTAADTFPMDEPAASRRLPRPLTPGLLVGFAAIVLVLLGAFVAERTNLRNVYGAAESVAHTQAVRAALQELLAAAVDAETGQRGFILMGDESYLEPYRGSLQTLASDIARARTLTADNPAQQSDLDQLRAAADRRFSLIDESIRLRRESGFAAAQAIIATGDGKRMMDAMRVIVARMEAREEALLAARNQEAERSYREAQVIAFVTTGLALFVVGLLFFGTRRFGAERRLAEQTAERLNVTLRSIGDGVITTDNQGRIHRMNPVAETLTGWSEAEAAGRRLEEALVMVNEGSRLPVDNPVTRVLREGTVVGLANHTILIGRDGRELPIDDSAAPIRDADGEMVGVVMVFRDISDRYAAERERAELAEKERLARVQSEEAEQRLHVALEAGRMGTWQFNIKAEEVKWSSGLEAIHGYAPGMFPGTFEAFKQEIYPDDRDRVVSAIAQAIQQRHDHNVEYRIVRRDGAVRWVEGRGRLFFDAAGQPDRLVGVCSDVTERKLAEDAQKLAKRQAEVANRTKDEFLAMVSHELRTPLNAVLGWADMLRSGTLSETRRERAIDAVYTNAVRQTKLIDELLDISRIMSGKLPLDRAPLDLRGVVQSGVDVIQPSADAKHINLSVDAGDPIPEFFGDAARLQQILGNLLSNAIKFTPEGGTVRVSLRRSGSAIELTVADNGQGIPGRYLPIIFEPFRQADQLTTRQHGGLGLGLSIVRHLVEAHGGQVQADSAGEGRGSTFTVQLPIVHAGPGAERATDHAETRTGPDADGVRLDGVVVLVVDDDDDNRDLLVVTLQDHGAAVLTASSAAQALEVLQRSSVDALLSDIAMPGEDGYSLIRRLRGRETEGTGFVPAAALTSLAREEDRIEALRAGFQLHLSKPIASASLVEAFATLVGGRWTATSPAPERRVQPPSTSS